MMVLFLSHGLVHATLGEYVAPRVTMWSMREGSTDAISALRKAFSDVAFFDYFDDYQPPLAISQPHT